MKRNVLLVTRSGNELIGLIEEAARKTGRGLKKANSTQPTPQILSVGLEDVDLAIVEMDASLHSIAIVEALNCLAAAPPVIALIKADEAEATPIVRRYGATAYLTKPFSADELATLMDKVCASAWQNKSLSCDKWGHVRAPATLTSPPDLTPVLT
jgi:DNA-binding response OmpR family regulator